MDFWGRAKQAFQNAYLSGIKKKLAIVGIGILVFIIFIAIIVVVILGIDESNADKITMEGGIIKPFGVLLSREEFIACVQNYDGGISYKNNMVPYAEDFYDICVSYDISPEFAFAHSCLETSYGAATLNRSNYFGLGANNENINNAVSYNSCAESIKGYCELMTEYRTPGTDKYQLAINAVEQYSNENEKLVGTPEDNLYVWYIMYSALDSTHKEGNLSTYYFTKAMYGKSCTHELGTDTTNKEQADYKVYTTDARLEIMEKIFGISVRSTILSSNSDIVNKAAELFMELYVKKAGYNLNIAHSNIPPVAGRCQNDSYGSTFADGGGKSHNLITDCSAFVDWVLMELGEPYGENKYATSQWMADIRNGTLTQKGWLCFQLNSEEDFEKIQPGDIWVRDGHMFIIAEVYRDSNGKIQATSFDAGNEGNWLNHGGMQSECGYIKNRITGPYIVRIAN